MAKNDLMVWNRFAKYYDQFMKRDTFVYKEIIERTALLLGPDDHVLDIATGTGNIALGLADRIKNIDAIDFSADMVAVAQKKAQQLGFKGVKFFVQNACSLQYEANSFDVVIIANALHIMPETEKVLAEIRRVLKPEGKLIAPTFMHAGSIKAKMLFPLMLLTGFRAYHKWTPESYREYLEENGYDVVDLQIIKASFPLVYITAKQK